MEKPDTFFNSFTSDPGTPKGLIKNELLYLSFHVLACDANEDEPNGLSWRSTSRTRNPGH
jgi:hypothetical protein